MLLSLVDGYTITQTSTMIKLSRQVNQLEQGIFIEKDAGIYMKVLVCIKPGDFHEKHKFTMVNIVPLGVIMGNRRRDSFPLTQEWQDLAVYLSQRVKLEINNYFQQFDTYEKIMAQRAAIAPLPGHTDGKNDLLVYAAIKTRQTVLLNYYLDALLSDPMGRRISYAEYVTLKKNPHNIMDFWHLIQPFAQAGDFDSIERTIATY